MNETQRQWGMYRVLYDTPNTKVKELIVNPGKSLSMQKHFKRSEYWHVVEGSGVVHFETVSIPLEKHDVVTIPSDSWHRLENNSQEDLKMIEIQYGESCIEEDIERK